MPEKPSRVRIFDTNIKVSYHKTLDRGESVGLFYIEKKLIKVANDLDWEDHLLHEILHAILRLKKHYPKVLSHEEEEHLVQDLEEGLKGLYRLRDQ